MTINMVSMIILFAAALGTAVGIVVISSLLGRGKKSEEKNKPYECGIDPIGSPGKRFSVKYFIVGILFIIFDVEIVFLYPWAIVFNDFLKSGQGVMAFSAAAVFIGVLLLGLIYVWGKGALEWEE